MKRFACIAAALYILLFSGCTARTEDHVFFAMDTLITLRLSGAEAENFRLAEELAAEIETSLSRTRKESAVFRINESETGITDADRHLLAVTEISLQIARDTDGAFSPAMGTLTDLWNVNGGGPVPSAQAIAEAKSHADFRLFSVDTAAIRKSDSAAKLDFGAVGKGYAAEQMVLVLRERCAWGLISLGGNVGVFGEKPDGTPFKIGITNPKDTSAPIGYLLIGEGFVSVSGDYERFFEEDSVRYHHILDPATGCPADSGLSSAAVWSRDGARADALSTALFVMGAEKAMAYYEEHPGEFEAVLITKENEILLTPGLSWGENFLPAGDSLKNP